MDTLGILRDIKKEELDLMLAWRNEPKVRSNMYTQHIISQEEHYSWWIHMQDRKDQVYYMYEFEGQPCGIAALNNLDLTNRNSAWAFYSAPSAPRGTGVRMEYLMLEQAFITLKLHKLYCEVLSFNKPVISLHQKFGFEVEGIFLGQHVIDGEYIDIHRLAILKKQWEHNRTALLEKITIRMSR
ncbi:spermidine N1-acetyltransferase [Aeromonas encheleia]|uniref:UDP-4-amino-4, 6-dideoxy-N-acetyl-beta-L-altrosamine N-acetyltransferase n=1 Tax=Aeromonas encheleia TaxID=73010 RepID=UPI000F70BB2E|nr:UDP-4-amino-4,6-dideoxy-N-acetyl-beta-L-altrosamine N-acetyltransferase [Aeromonas encheleia]VEG96016.1 spermidine N1-acetyltransferase [Aeromonas encheleia]